MEDKDRWTTHQEINFIRRIGTGKHAENYAVLSTSRRTLLERYRAAAQVSQNWDLIDRERVLAAVAQELGG